MKNISRNLIKIVIFAELLGFCLLAIATSVFYFITCYSDYFSQFHNPEEFWIGFALISTMIIASGFSLAFIIMITVALLSNNRKG